MNWKKTHYNKLKKGDKVKLIKPSTKCHIGIPETCCAEYMNKIGTVFKMDENTRDGITYEVRFDNDGGCCSFQRECLRKVQE